MKIIITRKKISFIFHTPFSFCLPFHQSLAKKGWTNLVPSKDQSLHLLFTETLGEVTGNRGRSRGSGSIGVVAGDGCK